MNTEYFTGNAPLSGPGHDGGTVFVVHDLGGPFENARAPSYTQTHLHFPIALGTLLPLPRLHSHPTRSWLLSPATI